MATDPQPPQQSENELIANRLKKAEQLAAKGFPAYPDADALRPTLSVPEYRAKYDGMTAEQLQALPAAEHTHRLVGRVLNFRDMGKTVFAPLREGGKEVQLFLNANEMGADAFANVKLLDNGDYVGVEGIPMRTRTGELSLKAKSFRPISKTTRPMPEKYHGIKDKETRYRQRYADLIANPEVADVFRMRSKIVRTIRNFLEARGFLEVETPMMHPLAGGAAARPFKTHHNALDMELFMRIAPELYLKRLVVGGLDAVYEINRNFRNEGLSLQHNPEFTMLEFYVAYKTYRDLMDLTEDLISSLARELHGKDTLEYHYDLNDREKKHDIAFAKPWRRTTIFGSVAEKLHVSEDELKTPDGALRKFFEMKERQSPGGVVTGLLGLWPVVQRHLPVAHTLSGYDALQAIISELQRTVKSASDAQAAGEPIVPASLLDAFPDFVSRHARLLSEEARREFAGHLVYILFEALVEKELVQPTFVHDFPIAVSPLARRNDKDPSIADRFELFIAGREIANAFSELNDPRDQEARFKGQMDAKAAGDVEAMPWDADYIRALEYGLPPTAGEGSGIDRHVMLLTDQATIRDVILFPLKRQDR